MKKVIQLELTLYSNLIKKLFFYLEGVMKTWKNLQYKITRRLWQPCKIYGFLVISNVQKIITVQKTKQFLFRNKSNYIKILT